MSGGRFDYAQYRLSEIVDSIEQEIRDNDKSEDDYSTPHNFKPGTLAEFQKGIDYLKKAQVYAQRIDWLVSGDDGEETFHERLKEDLAELKQKETKPNPYIHLNTPRTGFKD